MSIGSVNVPGSIGAGRVINTNILDNSHFQVNQRSQDEYIADGYTVDRYRWYGNFGKLQVIDNGVRISNEGKTQVFFGTPFEASRLVAGQTYTASIVGSLEDQFVAIWVAGLGDIAVGTSPVTFTMPSVAANTECRITTMVDNVNAVYDLYAFKIEPGPVQTLAHKDAVGSWILNDPPPDPALELAKCQRYQFVINPQHLYAKFGIAVSHDIDMVFADVALPVPLRALPAIQVTNVNNIRFIRCGPMEAEIPITNVSLNSIIGNIIYLNIEVHGISVGDYGFMDFSSTDARIVLDANL